MIYSRRRWFGSISSLLLMIVSLQTSTASAALSSHDLNGVWWIEDYRAQILPADGMALPFTPKGLAQYQANMQRLQSGELKDPSIAVCLPEGLPRAMNSAYPLQIVQHGQVITVMHEANHDLWNIALDAAHPNSEDLDPAFMGGSSIGHWDGDSLIVDSIGFKANSFIDSTGVPHSDKLHVVQRFRRIDQGRRIEVEITIDDPEIFAAPFTARRIYARRPDIQLMEWSCGEDHRYLPDPLRTAVPLQWSRK